MAKLASGLAFIGTLDNRTCYTMRGSDKIIVRLKGGPSKEKIKTHANFDVVRRNNAEFGGRASTSREIMDMIYPHKALGDFNLAPALNRMLVIVQRWDAENDLGRRNVYLSRNPQILEGFDLNGKNGLSSVIRNPLTYSLSRTSTEARIEIPALLPGINFFAPDKYSFFSIIGTVGVVPDMAYDDELKKYSAVVRIDRGHMFSEASTAWLPCINGSEAASLAFTLKELPPGSNWSLMMALGIRFAAVGPDGKPRQVKYAGAAKILGMR
jgi:hypothetical protein